MKLDLGSGPTPAEGFEGVDRVAGAQHNFDLTTGVPWPWPDNSIEALRCSHFIEHIPATDLFVTEWPDGSERGVTGAAPGEVPNDGDPPGRWVDALIFFFEQAYRVIVPGGCFEVIWPALKSEAAFQDPTHRRFIPPKQLAYLNRDFRASQRLAFLGARCHWVVERCDGVPSRELPDDPTELELAVLTQWDAVGEYRALLRAVKP
jgi:hypothetical protein